MNVAEIATARLIGAVFVERGLLSESQIRVALEIQQETGQQLGQILVERFGVTRQELASVVAEQWADIGRSSPPGIDAAANESWRRLGEIFVERGFVTPEQLEQALQRQRETGERVGEALVAQGSISKFELAGALAEQMSALEEAAAAGDPAPAEATVVSLAARLEPVDVQALEPVSPVAPPVEEPAPGFGQVLEPVSPLAPPVEEPPGFGQVLEPVSPLAPPVEEPPPGFGQVLEPVSPLAPPVDDPAPGFGQMLEPASPPETTPLGLVQPEPDIASGWVAFASTPTGYRLVHVDGSVPAAGETVDVPEIGEVVVLRLGRSPMPSDARPCVYLEQLARADAAVLV